MQTLRQRLQQRAVGERVEAVGMREMQRGAVVLPFEIGDRAVGSARICGSWRRVNGGSREVLAGLRERAIS